MRQRTTPAPGTGQELEYDLRKSDSNIKPNKLNATRNERKALKQIARKWAARGYYPSPSAAMRVLLEGINHG